jgi:uncharacterized protein (DUF2384 family)
MNSPFRKRRPSGPVLSPDEGKRQGRAVRAAQSALGSVEAVREFLNSHHHGLGGRPLDLAVESEIGLAAVEALLTAGGTPPLRHNRSHSNRPEARS